MGRWEPNARGRLAKAALDLYSERGFEQTTVAEIARRAGLTERTYFRHYADKREVLFGGSELRDLLVEAVAGAPEGIATLDLLSLGLEAMSTMFDDRRAYARKRQAVIVANTELRERELIKLASLSAALAETLRGRGVPERSANLSAETGIAVFKVGFERWIADGEDRAMALVMREVLDELTGLAARGGGSQGKSGA
ncbi:helix-turn-helix domain-containing protein [Streptomyces sp. NPDC051784]|uniref:TetR/AcrR family transcriptional regulator n=1 Tax=Streptomyces sp. NPDC051784 TaxID=3155805 RepID=UPI00343884E9